MTYDNIACLIGVVIACILIGVQEIVFRIRRKAMYKKYEEMFEKMKKGAK